jgi:hypothetical protein
MAAPDANQLLELGDSFDLHKIPATPETIAKLPQALRREISQRVGFGGRVISELTARCFLNESRRRGNRAR